MPNHGLHRHLPCVAAIDAQTSDLASASSIYVFYPDAQSHVGRMEGIRGDRRHRGEPLAPSLAQY